MLFFGIFFLSLNYLHSRRTLGSCFTSDYGSQLSVILKSLIDGDDWQAPLKGSLLKISFKKGKCAICEFGSLKNRPKVISLASERRKKKAKCKFELITGQSNKTSCRESSAQSHLCECWVIEMPADSL